MKVLHIGLASHFTENMLYQDNILSELNAKDGHDVTYISDTFMYRDGQLVETEECDKTLDNGVRLIRLKYDKIINEFITIKVQKAKQLVKYLNEIKPDTILYHGLCGYELMDVANYVKNNNVSFYIDSHEDFANTAKTFVSKLAYKYIHGVFVKKAVPHAKKIFFTGYPRKYYLKKMYNISEDKLEYFPLGGIILDIDKQKQYRDEIINDLNYPRDVIICTHSGKMDALKKTKDILIAFKNVNSDKLRLIIYGTIPYDMKDVLIPLIDSDNRVKFLGWKKDKEQEKILGATDLYIQPGSDSVTSQVALCSGCALVYNREYKATFLDNVFYADNEMEIKKILEMIVDTPILLEDMKKRGFNFAKEKLDYKKLANRYLE